MSAALLELMADTLTAELPAPMRNLRLVLSSVARYGLGTSILIKLQAQYVPHGQVPATSWEHRLPYLELPPPSITIRSPLAVAESFDYDLMAFLQSSPPSLLHSAKTKTSVKPILHAEIRLFSFWFEHLIPRILLNDRGRLRIGSNSDTCACCEVWLRAASRSVRRGLIVQSSGRLLDDWAISGMAMPGLLRACDDNVQKMVLDTLMSHTDLDSSDDDTMVKTRSRKLSPTVSQTPSTLDSIRSELSSCKLPAVFTVDHQVSFAQGVLVSGSGPSHGGETGIATHSYPRPCEST
ncbi:hypothetical protein FA95DRAFT_48910 [Auriscalpium vulgare]|uniref:Uncharacterized protein n=1 Tax=Auriscalpium vulgare TaxID=40419 RepID=A0ACB8SCI6_9AGAM|nr:hypothetical protein FA95DRAFT_48910 [Auriscalpium vulgare]